MKIAGIPNYTIYNRKTQTMPKDEINQIQFSSTRAHIADELGNAINCHYTNMFREDVNWQKFAELLKIRFSKQDPVVINIFGVSDGSEAYTLAIWLKKTLGKLAKKFRIEASDLSSDMVKQARDGRILLHQRDLDNLSKLQSRYLFARDYNAPIENMRGIDFYSYDAHIDLRNMIRFTQKDVRQAVKTHDFSNEVFIFRNGWTFMPLNEQEQLAKNLAQNSNEKTLFLIGQSDLFKSNANEYLQKNGLKGINSEIFNPVETDYPSTSIGQPHKKSNYPEFILFEKK